MNKLLRKKSMLFVIIVALVMNMTMSMNMISTHAEDSVTYAVESAYMTEGGVLVEESSETFNTYNASFDVNDYEYVLTYDEFISYLKEALAARKTSIKIGMPSSCADNKSAMDIFQESYVYSSSDGSKYGDAIKYNLNSEKCETVTVGRVNKYYNYTVSYNTTAAQEQQVESAITLIVKSLNMDNMSEADKVRTIHKYICDNVNYDNDHLSDSSYLLQYTDYAALFNKTAVCQGYALVFYRMAIEAGLSARIVSGNNQSHAWNIVKVGSLYYDIDTTWDGQDSDYKTNYLLKGSNNFNKDHTLDSEFNTTEFMTNFPISTLDYTDAEDDSISSDTVAMYRLYNPNSGEHFYTADSNERNFLVNVGWNYEGIAWYAPLTGNAVYRVYNPNTGDHHYTLSEGEKNILVSLGWNDEGIGWYSSGTTPIYRLYNPNCDGAGSHHYTLNSAERDMLISVGWNYEGIGWYSPK